MQAKAKEISVGICVGAKIVEGRRKKGGRTHQREWSPTVEGSYT